MTKLMFWLLPSVVIIVLAEGLVSYRVSYKFIDIALERNVRVQTLAIAHGVNTFLDTCKRDLLFVAKGSMNEASLRDFLARKKASGWTGYRELSYVSPDNEGHVILVSKGQDIFRIPEGRVSNMSPDPFMVFEEAKGLKPGQVSLSRIVKAEYPFPSKDSKSRRVSSHIIRFATPCDPDGDGRFGYLVLAVDVRRVRDILSLYNSDQSPLWGYPRSDELRFNYLFDPQGWILFQSEDLNQDDPPLTTYLARTGLDGTLGRPGLDCAFRPSSGNMPFWSMIADIGESKANLLRVADKGTETGEIKQYYFSYAPVTFDSGDGKPRVHWGVAYVDRSKLTLAAGYRHLDSLFIITLVAVGGISLILFVTSRLVTRPVLLLSRSVDKFRSTGEIRKIDLHAAGYETGLLSETINDMIDIIRQQRTELKQKDEIIRAVSLMEKADIASEVPRDADGAELNIIPEIVGHGPKIVQLKSDILKASQADVDVLILGETGTGKQLTAEAVHRHSGRSSKPFISINCGALDENLLLDTLFGHVKGAFTEARGDRKGAFLEAHGGTLFLDEIQAASAKVQQSLLRAISMRKIKPLGSDKELDVDVRLIAATNADLPELIKAGDFREDLYFRLKVITVQTPSLKEHPESIPALTMYYLHHAEQMVGRKGVALSKGALEKLKQYEWPGNIRELINVITRAVVMTEHDIIQATDIRLEGEDRLGLAGALPGAEPWARRDGAAPEPGPGRGPGRGPVDEEPASAEAEPAEPGAGLPAQASPPRPAPQGGGAMSRLNARQRRAYPEIMRRAEISRQDYQDIVGGGLPSRTAVYDLQDMVKKGLLTKSGKGPATRYVVPS
ncbi:sigma 54-interacting transcriptional regulator [Desulfocurvus sp. DL9XJH121]